jgi:death-on-curing protein
VNPGVPEVLFFHTVAIQRYGGAEGVRDTGALEAAVARPWSSYAGKDAFPTPFDKAAAICEAIINRHPFVDGNKRTALSAGVYLLSASGSELDATPKELENLAVDIAMGRLDIAAVSKWFEAHCVEA